MFGNMGALYCLRYYEAEKYLSNSMSRGYTLPRHLALRSANTYELQYNETWNSQLNVARVAWHELGSGFDDN